MPSQRKRTLSDDPAVRRVYERAGRLEEEFLLLDLQRWTLTVRHPKGEGSWAVDGERVRLFPDVRPFVLNYLDYRATRIRQLDLDPASVEPLFPNEKGSYYSETGWRMARYKVFRSLGIEANYKVLRASFAQKLKDHGAPIENVSMALRHKTVATTEQFYARVRTDRAWDAFEELWSKPEVRVERR